MSVGTRKLTTVFSARPWLRGSTTANKTSTLTLHLHSRLVILSNDVERNPGPVKWPCTICSKSAKHGSVSCTRCQSSWTHLKCIGSSMKKYNFDFICKNCIQPAAQRKTVKTKSKRPSLKIISWNINGWWARRGDIDELIRAADPDVLLLQEIKIAKESVGYCPSNYRAVIQPRNSRGGGTATLVKKPIDFSILESCEDELGERHTIILNSAKPLYITNTYLPPGSSNQDEVLYKLETAMHIAKNHLILGDANAHHKLWDDNATEDTRGEKLEEITALHAFIVLNEPATPTRITTGCSSSPDVALASADLAPKCTWKTSTQRSSDHCPQIVTIGEKKEYKLPKRSITNFRKANWSKFKEIVERKVIEKWAHQLPRDPVADTAALVNIIKEASAKTIPKGRIKLSRKPDDTAIIRTLVKERNKAQEADPLNQSIPVLNAKIKSLRETERSNKWKEQVEKMEADRKGDPNALWKIIKRTRSTRTKQCPVDCDNGRAPCTGSRVAEAMARRFIKAGVGKDTKVSLKRWRTVKRRLKIEAVREAADDKWKLIEVVEVTAAIEKAKASCAEGPDGITMLHLKKLPAKAIQVLREIFNQTILQNRIPEGWKKAHVIMLPKQGKDQAKIEGYRPISLLSPLAKTLERIVLNRISAHIMPPAIQHGFRKGHSTTTAITTIINDIASGINMPNPPKRSVLVCLDLSQAFDSVALAKLSTELAETNMSRLEARWITCYLHKRKIRVLFDDSWSSWKTLRGGVPQGGVLSPNLFNFYLRKIPEHPNTRLVQYADDVSIIAQGIRPELADKTAQEHVDLLFDFFTERSLDISPSKSVCMLATSHTGEYKWKSKITWNGVLIDTKNEAKILGVTIDTMMCMSKQVKNISSGLARRSNVLRGLGGTSWGSSKETMLKAHNAILKPVALYCGPAWQQLLSDSQTKKLEAAYRNSLRLCAGLQRHAPGQHILDECKALPLKAELELQTEQLAIAAARNPSHPLHNLKSQRHKARKSNWPCKPPMYFEDATTQKWTSTPGTTKSAQKTNHTLFVKNYLAKRGTNKTLGDCPPDIDPDEKTLPRSARVELTKLRCAQSMLVPEYEALVTKTPVAACGRCADTSGNLKHMLECRFEGKLTILELWTDPIKAASILGLQMPYDPGGSDSDDSL